MAYEGGDYSRIEELPYKIIPGEVGNVPRGASFLERAIVGERLRLSIGLPLRPIDQHAPLSAGIEASAVAEKVFEAAPYQRHQVRLQLLPGEKLPRNGPVPGLRLRLPEGVPQRVQ